MMPHKLALLFFAFVWILIAIGMGIVFVGMFKMHDPITNLFGLIFVMGFTWVWLAVGYEIFLGLLK